MPKKLIALFVTGEVTFGGTKDFSKVGSENFETCVYVDIASGSAIIEQAVDVTRRVLRVVWIRPIAIRCLHR
jgi:hypothetical protein